MKQYSILMLYKYTIVIVGGNLSLTLAYSLSGKPEPAMLAIAVID